jgi:hypothetical protein
MKRIFNVFGIYAATERMFIDGEEFYEKLQ